MKIRAKLESQRAEVLSIHKALDSSALVSMTDKDGTITFVNKMFCKISKYSEKELIGQNHRILKSEHHPPEFFDDLWGTISSGKTWQKEIKNLAKDGSYYWVNTTIVPLLDDKGIPEQYVSVRIDITKEKELEKHMQSLSKDLESANIQLKDKELAKDEFASMISHELKTPLAPIIGWCEALQDQNIMGKITPEQCEALVTIQDNALRLEKLIGDLLDAQKLDLGRMKFSKTDFQADEMISQLVKSFEYTVKKKQVHLVNLVKEKIKLKSDRQRIEEVLSNLIYNSLDFVSENVGRIEINVKNQNSVALFSVKDNGEGVPKEKLDSLFKKFYQTDTSLTRKHGGTGLGLTICKGIVENLGGKIWVESKLGESSTFSFTIPKGGDKQ